MTTRADLDAGARTAGPPPSPAATRLRCLLAQGAPRLFELRLAATLTRLPPWAAGVAAIQDACATQPALAFLATSAEAATKASAACLREVPAETTTLYTTSTACW
jgi:hypothetical protein